MNLSERNPGNVSRQLIHSITGYTGLDMICLVLPRSLLLRWIAWRILRALGKPKVLVPGERCFQLPSGELFAIMDASGTLDHY
jgi:hypothetical protein